MVAQSRQDFHIDKIPHNHKNLEWIAQKIKIEREKIQSVDQILESVEQYSTHWQRCWFK